ncbi:MAG TPA: hypothetical protein VG318_14330 [Actinomycetota bacterium]|nr:hypothetical protein [Actinomycetota bacterium]
MNVAFPEFKLIRFPGEAGRLQEAGMSAALVRELGDHYERYHDFLADRLRSLGAVPVIADYDSSDAYLADWQLIHEVLIAESMLRACRRHRLESEPLSFAWDGLVPLVDEDYGLISVSAG